MSVQRDLLTPIAFLLLCCMFLCVAGCSRLIGIQSTGTTGGLQDSYKDHYLSGIKAYFADDYKIAAEAFLSVFDHTNDPVLARKALYGLACARFMLADSEDGFKTAMKYWQAWLHAAPQNWSLENPLLFDPIVAKQFAALHECRDTVQYGVEQSATPPIARDDIEFQDELARVKEQLKVAKQQAAQQQDAIRALEQENARLKEQIRAIELIDQKIQEKKTAIPSTE